MNDFNLQKNAVPFCEESGGWISISDSKGPVVCPKPRRVGVMAYSLARPLRWNMSTHRAEMYDVKAGAELLDIILTREGHGADPFTSQVASSPPFFCGSPPARVGNPLIQDAQFGEEEQTPPSPIPIPSPSTTTLKGGCARMKVGPAVRVEGFDCLNRDHQNSSIRAMA